MLRSSIMPAGLLLAALCAASSHAQTAPASPQVTVSQAWSRATPPRSTTGALYLTLSSPTGDTLVGASTPAAKTAEVHRTQMNGEVMEMRPVEGGLDLPAGKAVTMRPGGYHIMLMDLAAPLQAGQGLPVHLTFKKAPPMDVVARVQPFGASGPAMDGMPGMPMH